MAVDTKKDSRKSTLYVARDFLARVPGAYLFPIKPGQKAPPLFKGELTLASNEPKLLAQWHQNYPACNWGLANKKSRMIVLDIDTKPGKVGDVTLDTLVMTYGELPNTLTVRTPSGGLHYFFKEANGVVHRHRLGEYGFGKDIDCTNYVVIAGSVLDPGGKNGDGGEYTIINDVPVADAPEWFGEFLKEVDTTQANQTPVVELDTPAIIGSAIAYLKKDSPNSIAGQNGDATTLQVAGTLKDMGISQVKAVGLMAEHYNTFEHCDPLWSVGEIETKVANAYNYLKQNAPGSRTAEADFAGDPVTPDDLRDIERAAAIIKSGRYSWKDFLKYQPERDAFIFVPAGADDMWPGKSVDGACEGPPVIDQRKAKCKTPAECEAIDGFPDRFSRVIDERKAKLKTPEEWKAVDGYADQYVRDAKGNTITERLPPTIAITYDRKQRVACMTWYPGKPAVIRDMLFREGGIIPMRGINSFNRYRAAPALLGSYPEPKMWLDHVKLIYPDDWQHIVYWLAWRVQHPDVKILHALVMGGATRIGKDTILKPVVQAIGPWNFKATNAQTIMDEPKYNGFLESVICIINEAQDFGNDDRYAFYNRMKPWLGGTATSVLMVADKYVRAHPVFDVFDPIITTNHKVRGLYLPEDDARHYVAWSNRTWEDWGFPDLETLDREYFGPLYAWYANGGNEAVAHYLMNLDLKSAKFSPTSPPLKTTAWHEIVNAYRDPNKSKVAAILETLGNPPAVTSSQVQAADSAGELDWLSPQGRNTVPAQFEDVGYVHQRNTATKKGTWQVGKSRREIQIYVAAKLSKDDRWKAALELFRAEQARAANPPPKSAPKATDEPDIG